MNPWSDYILAYAADIETCDVTRRSFRPKVRVWSKCMGVPESPLMRQECSLVSIIASFRCAFQSVEEQDCEMVAFRFAATSEPVPSIFNRMRGLECERR